MSDGADILAKLPLSDLMAQLKDAKQVVRVGVMHQHYGGERYYPIGHTVDKNSNILRVVYVPETHKGKPDQVPFDCPLMEWTEIVQTTDYAGPRFRAVEEA